MKHTFVHAIVLPACGVLALASTAGAADTSIIDRGPHSRTWQTTRQVQASDGSTRTETGSYIELQGGLHHWTEKGWAETRPRIEVFQEGAVAAELQYQATFAPNLATPGAIDLLLPDGQRLQGHLLGLALTEGNRSVLIAEVKDCAGVIGGAEQNEVTFADAFTDFDISVQFVLQRDRISQNVIVHQQLPHPSEWGLTEDAVLEVLTEFTTMPAVRVENRDAVDGIGAQHVTFESMEFVSGKAFSIGNEANATTVSKTWELFEGQRSFLVEKVPWKAIAPELVKLPPVAKDWKKKEGPLMARKQLRLPRREQARAAVKPIQMAQVNPKRGYLIDWELVSSVNWFRWSNSVTHYIAGNISVKTNIFEGGTVIKYTNNAKLTITGPVTCLSSIYAPIILTARDDHSVGEAIGSASLSGVYANTALYFDNGASGQLYEMSNVRISHADTGIRFQLGNGHKLRNLQIVNCNYAISSFQSAFDVLNGLFSKISTYAIHPAFTSGTIGTLQNVTIRECNTLVPTYGTARVTNSLLIAVTNIVGGGTFSGAFNGTNSNPTNVFQPVGAGYSYLTNNSSFRNAGTTNIDSTLRASLQQLTTYPPIVAGHVTTIGNTNWTLVPQALRDTNAPDLGFHYPPIDWAFGGVYVTNSTITAQTGTAIAFYSPTNAGSTYGIRLGSGAKFFSDGSAANLNRLIRYNVVQEQSASSWNTPPGESVSSNPSSVSVTPEARFTFTQWSTPAADTHHFYGLTGTDLVVPFTHSEFIGGRFRSDRPKVSITNCLFHRVDTIIDGSSYQINPTFQNCLVYGGSLKLTNSQAGTWKVYDTLFHGAAVSQLGTITHDYNGYITNAVAQWLTNSGSANVWTNTFDYQTGALGRFYQPTNSRFLGFGSTSASYIGLYHFTTLTNDVKETNSLVDIGYHFASVPIDSDGDGIPDYVEDADSDGFTDPGEYSFANPVLSVPASVSYMRGSPPRRLNPTGTAYDIDTPNFAGGQLTVWTVVFANINDRLGIHHEGNNPTQIGVDGNTVYYGGTTIGTFSGGTADTPLVVSFNGYASNAAVQAVVRSITFQNVSSTNAISSRFLQYTLTDGTGGATTAFQSVSIVCAGAVDAMLLIDNSQSMTATNFAKAKAAASNFVSLLNFTTDRVGLISFAGYAYLDSPLTTNGPVVQSKISSLSFSNGTTFHYALDMARSNMTGTASNVMPLIVILSDGKVGTTNASGNEVETEANRVFALDAAAAVKAAGIRLITIAYGTSGGANNGTNLMRTFATSTGDFYYAPDEAEIETRYTEIASGLCRGLTPPQIAITKPLNPTELRGPATFRIETKTSDSDGFVKRVQFFNGSTSLGSVTNPPFQRVIANLAVGTNSFTAVATDDDNLSTTSSPPVVVVVVNCVTNALSSLTLNTNAIFSGLSATGYVTINGLAPRGGQTVLLSCTNPYVSIPPSVTVPQGETNATFRIDTRSATNNLNATITASLYGSTRSTNLTLNAANGHGLNVFGGQCGPMDVVFVRTLSAEFSDEGTHMVIRNAISNALNVIDLASAGDYQLGLISFGTNVYVHEQLALSNRESFLTNLYEPLPYRHLHASWDEALNTIVNYLPDEDRPQQGDFTNRFRAHARKIVVLLSHSYPMGFGHGDEFQVGIDDVNAHRWAVQAWLQGIEVAAILVLDNTYVARGSMTYDTMSDVALTTGGPLVWTESYENEGLEVRLPHALSRCGADLGEVVFVRDDARQNSYAAFAVRDSAKETSADVGALFDTSGIDGAVTGMRSRRNGQLLLNHGSRFDMQLGVRSALDTNLLSFGISLPNAHTNPVARWYDAEWELPFPFYPDLEQHFGSNYDLELRDRADGACGDNFEIVDTPAGGFPLYRNTLTFKVLRPFQIPQGRCRDFILTGPNLPVSETWTVTLFGEIIASSQWPNGWNVEHDYTAYKGFNICVPSNAVVSKQYEVRYQDAGGQGSASFEVLAAGTLESAPVLKPLELSSSLIGTNGGITVSVLLDVPAPPGGAVVGLLSTLSNAVPDSVTIPAGETRASVTLRVMQPVSSNTPHLVGAFYNGERQATFTIVHQSGSPAAPELQVVPELGRMKLMWDEVPTALFYRVERGVGICSPDFVADRVTNPFYTDTNITAGVEYCYTVFALNSVGPNISSCVCTQALPETLLTPIITPPGGKFYDLVSVTITNPVVGTQTYYSTNGFWPTNDIMNYVTQYTAGTVLTFTSNTVLKAKAYSSGEWGPLASRDFVINRARPISCGSNMVLSLSTTNWPSPVRGPGFPSERFMFNGGPGTNVTIKVTAGFAPHLILLDPAGQVVAHSQYYHPSQTEIIHTCRTNGNYIIDLTATSFYVNDQFSISLECEALPKLDVIVNGASVPVEGTVDMRITPINANFSTNVTITNWGAASLTISNLAISPTNLFTVTPVTNSIAPQGFTNLTVTFNSAVTGLFSGTLSFRHNDPEGNDIYFMHFLVRANPAGTPPTVVITNPVHGQVFILPTSVTNKAHAQATGTNVARVEFYVEGKGGTAFLGSDNSSPFEMAWGNMSSGQYTVRAVPIDNAGRFGLPTNVTVTFNSRPIVRRDRLAVLTQASRELEVLANDFDPDGDSLIVSSNSPPANGSASVSAGRLFYTAPLTPGQDSFTYTADDGRGGTTTTNIFITILPGTFWEDFEQIAEISFPTNDTQITEPIAVIGTAVSPYLRSYRLQYRPYRFPTQPWVTFAEGYESVTNAVLGTFDPTRLANGTYAMQLLVEDWLDGTTTTTLPILVHVGESFKVGHFTVAFNDLSIPVSGLPITLTRTYDSRDTMAGDFGAGWKLDVASARLEKSGPLGIGWGRETVGFGGIYSCVAGTEPHLVTITFPNDQKFQFEAELDINGRGSHCAPTGELPNSKALLIFKPLPGTTGTLVPLHEPSTLDINIFGGGDVTLHEDRGDVLNTYGTGPIYDPAEFLFTTLDGRQFIFNAAGKVVRMVDRNGNSLTFGDDGIIHSSGKSVLFVRDTAGRIKEIYDPNGLNASGQKAGPPAITYTYDNAFGNLTHVSRLVDRTVTNSLTTTFVYTNAKYPHFLSAIIDPRGITGIRNEYDDEGRLKSHTDTDGKSITYIHDINGRKETIVDRLGHTSTFSYDIKGNVTNSVNALGHTNLFTYDTDGNMLTHTDPLGNTTTNTYDGDGNVMSITLPHKPGENSESFTTRFTYDQFGNQTSVTLPTGAVIVNSFDPNTGELLSVKAGTNVVTSYTYDSAGNVTAEVDRFGTNSFELDEYGNATRFTNSLGQVISSDYDANGNLTNLVDGTSLSRLAYDGMGRETTSDYGSGITLTNSYDSHLDWTSVDAPTIGHMERHFDEQGRLGGWTTVNGSIPGFAYNANGELEYETNTLGVVTHTTYDAGGRVMAVTNLTTGAGTRYGYDAGDRRIAETNALGFTTRFGYNPDGSLAAMTNAFGTNYWLYAYETGGGCCGGNGASVTMTDPLGRQLKTVNSEYGLPLQTIFASGTNSVTNTTTYLSGMVSPDQETEDYPFTITDEGGRTRTNTYTPRGQLETSTDLGGNQWINQYDQVSGALTNILSPTGESLFYTYDELDNRKAFRFPDGNWLTSSFDAANRLATNQLPSGITVSYQYDFAGRITNRSSTIGETNSFQYNLADAVTVMTDNTGSTTNLYDAAGRLHGIDYPTGASVRYGFDLLGQVTSITNKPSSNGAARVTQYGYDAVGNITNITDPFSGVTSFEYDRIGRRKKRTLPNGVITTYDYNWRDQLTNIVHKTSGGTTLASAYYERAPFGEPTKIIREDGTYVILNYDASLRLTNEAYYSSGGVLQSSNWYAFDAAGNRVRLVTGGVTYTNLVSAGYRITEVKNGASVAESYSYDTGGRVTSMTRSSVTRTFGYTSSDQLAAVTNGGTWTTYAHDAQGRRTKSADNTGSQRRFLVAGTPGTDLESFHLIADSTNGLKQGYVFAGDDPVLRYDNAGNRVYYLEDAMGSVIGLVPHSSPGTGNTSRLFYDGFGKTRLTNGPAPSLPSGTGGDFRFHGAWWESATDLYHMRAREYDQRMGRFISRDPRDGAAQEPETFNPYVFARNNSYIYVDHSGEFTLVEINLTTMLNATLQTARTAAVAQARREAMRVIANTLLEVSMRRLSTLLPPGVVARFQGIHFENTIRQALCDVAGASGSYFHFAVALNSKGIPVNSGVTCNGVDSDGKLKVGAKAGIENLRGYAWPDFIIGDRPPKSEANGYPKTWIVGDIKRSTKTLYNSYILPRHSSQLRGMVTYAKNHTYARAAVFIAAQRTPGRQYKSVEATLMRKAIGLGGLAYVDTLFDGKGRRRSR